MRTFKTIHIPLPQNLPERYRRLFTKKSTYKVPELGVKEYKNVFVSHEGLCLQNLRLVPYSSFNICTRYDKSFGWQYYKLVLEQYLVSTFGKSLKKITFLVQYGTIAGEYSAIVAKYRFPEVSCFCYF